jgi:glycosyltransferase involved in cell wall biosynthesis
MVLYWMSCNNVKMRILLVMDPGIPVPPKGYGGHERLVYMFARQYYKLGHEVDLLVSPGSEVEDCRVYTFGKEGFPPPKTDALKAIPQAWKFLWLHRNDYNLIHNFGRLIYLLPILNHDVKKIMTYGREINKRNIKIINQLPNKNIVFTGCSFDLILRGGVAGRWKTIYNAIDFSKYTLHQTVEDDAPLIFLGRIERVKGCHTAIKVAKEAGKKLVIAGNLSPLAEEQIYFKKEIEPFIDGKQVMYVGQLNDEQKNYYLGKSKALLFPIEWSEPFGMVMVEAMACGTPVIGFDRGSVPEVIINGKTGFVVKNLDEMVKAITKIDSIDRLVCRSSAAKLFNVSVIAVKYLAISCNTNCNQDECFE